MAIKVHTRIFCFSSSFSITFNVKHPNLNHYLSKVMHEMLRRLQQSAFGNLRRCLNYMYAQQVTSLAKSSYWFFTGDVCLIKWKNVFFGISHIKPLQSAVVIQRYNCEVLPCFHIWITIIFTMFHLNSIVIQAKSNYKEVKTLRYANFLKVSR